MSKYSLFHGYNKEPISCKYKLAENPERVTYLRKKGVFSDGDFIHNCIVNNLMRKWKLLSLARDRLLEKGHPIPDKMQNKLISYEKWLNFEGYDCKVEEE
jgi:hypothetical protein